MSSLHVVYLPAQLSGELRDYFHETREVMAMRARANTQRLMSPKLQTRAAWEVNKKWLVCINFFRNAELPFLAQACQPQYQRPTRLLDAMCTFICMHIHTCTSCWTSSFGGAVWLRWRLLWSSASMHQAIYLRRRVSTSSSRYFSSTHGVPCGQCRPSEIS